MTFAEALELTKSLERDILLGNGFSIAAHDGFNYRHLLERASVPDDVRSIFAAARTNNFEAVMRILLAEMAGMDGRQASETRSKIEVLKEALVCSIHEVHPARRNLISEDQWRSCERFLEHFIGRKRSGRVFTTNYDLLLSWAVAPDRDRKLPDKRFRAYEGFKGGDYDTVRAANIIYLHGALHLYVSAARERQFQYRLSGVPLHDQVAEHLRKGEFPIIVTEGASSLKRPHATGFLKDAHAAFRGTSRGGSKKALFVLGHGLGPEDSHILDLIPGGTVGTLCLGAFRPAEMNVFHDIAIGWIAARERAGGPPLKVCIFNSEGEVWGT